MKKEGFLALLITCKLVERVKGKELSDGREDQIVRIGAKQHRSLRRHEFRENLTTGAAGTYRIVGIRRRDGDGAKSAVTGGYGGEYGAALRAVGQPERTILHVDAGKNRAIGSLQGGADPEAGIGRVGTGRRGESLFKEFPVFY